MITKTQQAIDFFKNGDHKKALRIAKDFRAGITKQQRNDMRGAYEALVRPEWYQQLGKDVDQLIEKGLVAFSTAIIKE